MKLKPTLILLFISFIALSCSDCKIVTGYYGGGMLSVTVNDNQIKGIIDITQGNPPVKCNIQFSFELNNNECEKSIKLINSLGNEFSGKIKIIQNGLFIQSLEPLGACQRIIDLNSGVTFILDQ